ncbi:hypothetical protein AAFN85_04545 [Mucilaginibacter sp. CAU 1740]|uniref:hypothetical protein n=1 Tax=Mucilaginibacter sp. CAU 1740 TaxID=3140365 RepID=UPI00325BA300
MSSETNTGRIQPDEERRKNNNNLKILGFNLLALVIYTVLCKLANNISTLVIEAFLVGLQVLVCLIVAAAQRDLVWLLSAFMVLAIGFSTCIYGGVF